MTQSESGPVSMKNDFTVRDGIATVELTQGRSMRVAEAALPLLSAHRWFTLRDSRTAYAGANVRRPDGGRRTLRAHRLLCGLDFGDSREVDHVDHDGLNNQPENMRVTGHAGNMLNLRGKRRWLDGRDPTSRRPGVSWDRDKGKWRADISFAGRSLHLGLYDLEADAAAAYVRTKFVRDAGGSYDEVKAARRGVRAPTSRFAGVYRHKASRKWRAQIGSAYRMIYLGCFVAEEDAAEVYRRAKAVRDAGGSYDEIKATRTQSRRRWR